MSMTTTDTTETTERCGQCGTPAAHDQRYCLNCGFHRRNAPDPVARYLSEASAARAQVAAARAVAAARRRRVPRLGPRVVSVLVALALLVGILIGSATAGGTASHSTAGNSNSHKTGVRQRAPAHKTKLLKNATGKSYLQQEQNLPTTVTP
jgi:hypothetical protein